MSRDLLIIPTFNRPEMLTLCIEGLMRTKGLDDIEIWIVVDDHMKERYDPDFSKPVYLLKDIPAGWLRVIMRSPHNCFGNSRSIMEAYKEAYFTDARLVFMVEDDIVVSEDFFRWCYSVHGDDRIACAVATRPEREGHEIKNREGHYVESDFASGAVCWKRQALAAVVPHACGSYYHRLNGYCDEHWPTSVLRGGHGEQDGLLRRIIAAEKLRVAWPWYPRAKHIGIYGYHDPRPAGTYQERLSALRKILEDPAEVSKWRGDCEAIIDGH